MALNIFTNGFDFAKIFEFMYSPPPLAQSLFYFILIALFYYLQVLGSCCWSAEAQSQFQTQFRNFEVVQQAELPPRGRSAAAAAPPPPPRSEQRETTTPVPILKQINE